VFTFSRRTTSLRVGGLAAGRSCLPGLRRGGGRQAGVTVLSCLVWLCELTAGQVRSASSGSATAGHTPDADQICNAPVWRSDSIHTATPDTTKQSCLCRVWRGGVN